MGSAASASERSPGAAVVMTVTVERTSADEDATEETHSRRLHARVPCLDASHRLVNALLQRFATGGRTGHARAKALGRPDRAFYNAHSHVYLKLADAAPTETERRVTMLKKLAA